MKDIFRKSVELGSITYVLKIPFKVMHQQFFIGIEKRIEMQCLSYLSHYLTKNKKDFANALKLPTSNYNINNHTKQAIILS